MPHLQFMSAPNYTISHKKNAYIIFLVVTDRPKPQLYANCFNFSKPARVQKNIYQQDYVMN